MNIIINNTEDLIEALKNHPNLRQAVTSYILEENQPPLPSQSDEPRTLENPAGHHPAQRPAETPDSGHDPVQTLTLEALNTAKQAIAIAAEARDAAQEASRNSRQLMELAYRQTALPHLSTLCNETFELQGCRIILNKSSYSTREFYAMTAKALQEDRITQDDRETILRTDFILSAWDNKWVTVEAALILTGRDIQRAADRASLLHKITKGKTFAAVVAQEINPELFKFANQLNVAMFDIEMQAVPLINPPATPVYTGKRK